MTSTDLQFVPADHPSAVAGSTTAAVLHFPAAAEPDHAPLTGEEHPAARLRRCGAAVLSDSELVTLITRGRVRTEADLRPARVLLQDGLAALMRRVETHARGVRAADAVRIQAAMELARRALNPFDPREHFRVEVSGPRLAARYAFHAQEHLGVLLLDSRDRLIDQREVFVGTLHSAFVSTRDIVRLALDHHAASIVVYHNHPSGDASASGEDHTFTTRLHSAVSLLDVTLLDHIIVGGGRYTSFRQRGYL